jgi:hypothetical protein
MTTQKQPCDAPGAKLDQASVVQIKWVALYILASTLLLLKNSKPTRSEALFSLTAALLIVIM